MKQAVKKKPKMSIKEALAKLNMDGESLMSLGVSNADKKMEWLLMPKGFVDATKLPGIPQGYVTTLIGHSNVGKTTIVNHVIAAAQQQGLLPILIDTEGNFDPHYAEKMGAEFEYYYREVVDEETSEVSQELVNYGGNFLYYNQDILAAKFGKNDYASGKELKEPRKRACIEDVAACINYWIDEQDKGNVPCGIVFIWDSVGSISGYRSITSSVKNNMFDAGSMSNAFNEILNSGIPNSRKASREYTNTLLLVNKIWMDSMSSPMSQPSMEMKGGKTVTYGSRLIIQLGGQLKAAVKRLNATFRGETYNYGIESKIAVKKNQLPDPFNITYEGKLICTNFGIVAEDEVDKFKKEKIGDILKARDKDLSDFSESEVGFVEEETDE